MTPKTILVVDDDPNIRDTAKDILEDAGFVVETAGTCAAAIEKLSAAPIDIALIDFNLPDGQGLELAVKAKMMIPKLSVLLLSGEVHIELGAAKSVIYAILTKPVDPSRLIEIIRKIVDS